MDVYVFLVLAVLTVASVWLDERWRMRATASGIVLLLAAGLLFGKVTPLALVWVAALFGAAWWVTRAERGKVFGWLVFTVMALGIGFGLLHGFAPITFTLPAPLKPDSIPYGVHFSFGKPLAAVAMLLWLVPVIHGRAMWREMLGMALPVIVVTAVVVPLLAWWLGYVHPQTALPSLRITATWMVINLVLVCPAEEAFFRGLLQRGLTRVVPPWLAVIIAAAAFGAAHFAGGGTYVLLSAVAGVGYGVAYQRSGQRIEASILAHFALNLTHFLLFTYPAAG